jgi:ABC-type antimicrobial peptide transport system permease subunit
LTRRILLQGAALTTIGIGLGLLLSRLGASRIADQLFQVSPGDPSTLATVALVVVTVCTLSVWWASVLATRTDPAVLLRGE